jgi:hypothetical protein
MGRAESCPASPTNLKELASCGGRCGAEKRLDALKKCARCLAVHYCDGACQREHWKRGGAQAGVQGAVGMHYLPGQRRTPAADPVWVRLPGRGRVRPHGVQSRIRRTLGPGLP